MEAASEPVVHSLVVACANAGRTDEALALLRKRAESGLPTPSNSYHALLRAVRAGTDPEASLEAFDAMASASVELSDQSWILGLGLPLSRDASWRGGVRTLTKLLATHDPPSPYAQEACSPWSRRWSRRVCLS